MQPAKTAAVLIIGNELLSGKVEEANLPFLARALRDLGIQLRRVVMVLDDIETIAREVSELSASHDWLFTSGGVGPTHDDVTVDAVAKAFGVAVVTSPEMRTMLLEHYKERCTEGHLRMALIPDGATLETTEAIRWPTIRFKNTWLMPGVPEVFRMKIPVLVEKLGQEVPFISTAVYTKMEEGDLKPLLDDVVAAFPEVDVGSYPKWFDPSYKTKVTFDGRDRAQVFAARDRFVSTLPETEPQRVD
ncbi:competence/damage-inducible protein A [Pendulispora rubella]|uniref:Competence/damage-inducible protein A n=1 Tax=Pendulispora rubella TaxID=2741070 RepID=A0ABZ2L047_9BACT